MLSVPYAPRGGPRPSEIFTQVGGDEEFYVSYFQQPGRAEAEIEPDVRGWLAGFYAALSADTMPAPDAPGPHFVSPGGRLRDRFPTGRLPHWLGESDLDVYAGEFERTGMGGALARYRNMDRDWEDLADFDGSAITQPSLFIGGGLDASTTWMADAINAYPVTLPGLTASHILDGCGHWIQQERPAEINRLLTDWLASLPALPA
jgi:pimeloyl-ACP methyl ester carboxylesterase